MSDADIDKAVKDAEQYAEEDRKRKEEIEVRNNADSVAYQTEKTIKDLGDKISDADKKVLEDKVAAVRKALEGTDTDAIKKAQDDLTNSSYEIFGKAYQSAQPQGDPNAAQQGAQQNAQQPHDDNVVDADYTVVDDDKDNK